MGVIKATELRIGNLIHRGLSKNYPLDNLILIPTIVTIEVLAEISVGESLVWDNEPIPLTQKWLTDFGFVNEIKPNLYVLGLFSILDRMGDQLDYTFFINFYDTSESWGIPICHVHQLQNLIFALTGEELKAPL